MSRTSGSRGKEASFVADRMLGTLTRYLRFMGYDTWSAHRMQEGNAREDTVLLEIADQDDRTLLTRDRELARRGGSRAVWIESEDVIDQIAQLASLGMISPEVRMQRCSLCNMKLRPATKKEVEGADYAPRHRSDLAFFWCPSCRKLYWMGSHGKNLSRRLEDVFGRIGDS